MLTNCKNLRPDTTNFRVLVIGASGTGKSIFASTFPEPILVFDFDKHPLSYRGKDAHSLQFSNDFKGWLKFTDSVRILTGQTPATPNPEFSELVKNVQFKTVVVDSTTALQDIAMEKALFDNPAKIPEGKVHYVHARFMVEKQIRILRNLKCNLVVISHVVQSADEKTGAVMIRPMLIGQLATKLPAFFEEVYFSKRTVSKDGKQKYELQTQVKGLYEAKSILSGVNGLLDLYVPNDYSKIMEMIKSRMNKS